MHYNSNLVKDEIIRWQISSCGKKETQDRNSHGYFHLKELLNYPDKLTLRIPGTK